MKNFTRRHFRYAPLRMSSYAHMKAGKVNNTVANLEKCELFPISISRERVQNFSDGKLFVVFA